MEKYKVTQSTVSQLIEDVRRDNIAIPELQRPFVWKTTKVRDLIDSLYKGYPVGYLITWQSVGAHIKGGETAKHQHILIDGQQRVTALRAAVAGLPVINDKYKQIKIKIAFNPITEEFATTTPIIEKDTNWISDISEFFNSSSTYGFVSNYFAQNPDIDQRQIENSIQRLAEIKNAQIGIISLTDDLDVETVSEIFIRINSKGVPLSSADFVMSKVASYGDKGRNLRKLIDYFCHLSEAPHAYNDITKNDVEFSNSHYIKPLNWLKNSTDELYNPSYSDVIRTSGLVGFSRGKASSIVSELSGRDPDTRKVDQERIPIAYDKLESALLRIVNQYDFENFVMTIKSAGFIVPKMISSKNALNFAYALYLRLRENNNITDGERKSIVRRWFVMSLLTGRHSGSFESTWELDIRRMNELGSKAYLQQIEESELTDGFWNVALARNLDTTSSISPYYQTYLASQVYNGSKGFLSKSITVAMMLEQSGDIHHLFPKDYLKKQGYSDRSKYNQVANYALTETAINIAIGNKAPNEYMAILHNQIASGDLALGEITNDVELDSNLKENTIPESFMDLNASSYEDFLSERRMLMARTIKDYYLAL